MRLRVAAVFAAAMGICEPHFQPSEVVAQQAWLGMGVGTQGCGTYLEQRRRPNRGYDDLVGAWVYGFISAYNYYGAPPQVAKDVNQDTALAFLDKFCRDAPLASVASGALDLVKVYTK